MRTFLIIIFSGITTWYFTTWNDRVYINAHFDKDSTSLDTYSSNQLFKDSLSVKNDRNDLNYLSFEKKKFPVFIDFLYLIFVLLLLVGIWVVHFYGQIILYKWKRIYSPFIYNHIKSKLIYLDSQGDLVSYTQENHITKLSLRRSKRMVRIPVQVDGTIDRNNTSAINSSSSFPSNNKVVFHCYFDSEDTIRNSEHYASYSFLIEKGFTNKSEYWIFAVGSYCKYYCLEVLIPIGKRVDEVRLMYREVQPKEVKWRYDEDFDLNMENDVPWEEVEKPKWLVTRIPDHTKIIVQITNLNKTDRYKLVWTLN
jgi:hypothetical protein